MAKLFGNDIDYGRLVKLYGNKTKDGGTRWAPAGSECIGTRKTVANGKPDKKHLSTSYVERQNLTMRMSMKRFARLSNAHSKKIENHMYALALHYMFYNFGRIHSSLRITPAMAAGVSDHIWSLEEIAALAPIEAPKKRGPYKKRGKLAASAK